MDMPDLNEITTLASKWQARANELITPEEKTNQKRLRQLILHPLDKAFLTKLIDQCFRSHDTTRIADQITYLLKRNSFPEFFSIRDVLLMWLFLYVGRHFPKISVPLVISKIKKDSGQSILPGETEALTRILKQQKHLNIRMNLTRLGPPAVGREEVNRRLENIIKDLNHPEINYISIKINSLCTQLNPISFDHHLSVLVDRLSRIFEAAQAHEHADPKGTWKFKFVNLDLENYADLELSCEAFKRTLDLPQFKSLSAGIALQAYLPESFLIQQHLTEWATNRTHSGGSPIKIRIVKGANLEMEKIKSSLHGWPLAPFDRKIEVDANYKRMIDYGLQNQRFKSVHLGIASHNIFELAYGFKSAENCGALNHIDLEMLYGIAGPLQRAIREQSKNLVLYAPAARKDDYIDAIGYLIRRLDENTGRDNFLRYANGLTPDSRDWNVLKNLFIKSCEQKDAIRRTTHRKQNRKIESGSKKSGTYHLGLFNNEPTTDWTIADNRQWVETIRKNWMGNQKEFPIEIPVIVANKTITKEYRRIPIFDPSLPSEQVQVATVYQAESEDISEALEVARSDPDQWREMTQNERHRILSTAAQNIRGERGNLIGAAAATTGKIFTESDLEVSHAVDYTEYYPHSLKPFVEARNLQSRGKGVGIVISPTYSPIAAPCNGIVAALAAGNTVVLKPSIQAALPAWLLCQCFWKAGVSKKVLQFLPGNGEEVGFQLATAEETDFVILKGRREIADVILKAKPNLDLIAQTGGKNATIVTPVSDRTEAIPNILASAFTDGGLKDSSVSLLILEKEVYLDQKFKNLLVDAVRSFRIGSAWDLKNQCGPLAASLDADQLKMLTELEEGESWALKPEVAKQNPQIWSPGIKWDVKPGSFTHLNPSPVPVLAVMCAEDFYQAITLANQPGFGATSCLECLDKRKQEYWKSHIKAGSLFINGKSTDSRVLRQPFGGWENSTTGRGLKTGGPNYIAQLLKFEEIGSPAEIATKYDRRLLRLAKNWMRKTNRDEFKEFQTDIQKSVRAMNSYLYHARNEFRFEKDFFHLRGQDNILRYLPVGKVTVRVHPDDTLFDILARIAAAQTAKCKVTVSVPSDVDIKIVSFLKKRERRAFLRQMTIETQTDDQLIADMASVNCIRYASPERVPDKIYQAAAERGFVVSADRVLMEGRIEMLNYYKSQSISHNYHRYGNLGARAFDQSMNSIFAPSIK